MIHLKAFQNHSDYETFSGGTAFVKPNTSYCISENEVHYNPLYDPFNGHEYVDLGLPSGTLWATMNVGANSITDYGLYFAWGETAGYSADQVTGSTTPHKDFSWTDYELANGSNTTLTKYNNNASYGYNGYTDSLVTLEASDDAATVNWGGEWHMPSSAQCQELIDNTTSAWTTDYNGSGVNGMSFTANGNTLFIPVAGSCDSGNVYGVGSFGDILSLSLDTDDPRFAWNLLFGDGVLSVGNNGRCFGNSVRGVVG